MQIYIVENIKRKLFQTDTPVVFPFCTYAICNAFNRCPISDTIGYRIITRHLLSTTLHFVSRILCNSCYNVLQWSTRRRVYMVRFVPFIGMRCMHPACVRLIVDTRRSFSFVALSSMKVYRRSREIVLNISHEFSLIVRLIT